MPILDPQSYTPTSQLDRELRAYQSYKIPKPTDAFLQEHMERAAKTLGLRNLAEEHAVKSGGKIGNPGVPPTYKSSRAKPISKPTKPGYQSYYHETDEPNVQSIREQGIKGSGRTSFGEGKQVFAWPERGEVPPGRASIEFQARPEDVSGHGTMGSRSVSFRGNIAPEDVLHGYTSEGQMFGGFPAGSALEGLNAAGNLAALATLPTPSGTSNLGSELFGLMGMPDVQVTNKGPQMNPAYNPPQAYGADTGWGTGSIPQGSLMQYALAQSMGRPATYKVGAGRRRGRT